MPLSWPRPLPLIFITAVPLLLMWAPARAFLGTAVSKLPFDTSRRLSQTLLGGPSGTGGVAAGTRRGMISHSVAASSSLVHESRGTDDRKLKRKVVIISGPTATGKSAIALALCKKVGGEIVSCDSVQVYTEVRVGCNKPSEQDMSEVPHHLVGIASLDETFNAGDFVDRAHEAIDDILSRGKVPVVVGGTMMYIHWLVHGRPDAPKKDPAVAKAVAEELQPYQDRGDWDGALEILTATNKTRAAAMSRNNWYRLSRSLEVLRGPGGEEAYTGLLTPPNSEYDFRSFFIMGDRERLFRRIDLRCEKMLKRGMLEETADLLARGMLDPASPVGRAIGYRQAIDFLSDEARLAGTTGDRIGSGSNEITDPRVRFFEFFTAFSSRTRQYAGEQMKWFRSAKGHDFSWQAWDLGGPIEEGGLPEGMVPIAAAAASSGTKHPNSWKKAKASPAQDVERVGDGRDWRDVVESIAETVELPREAFEEDVDGEVQAALRTENQIRAQDMKRYVSGVTLLADEEFTDSILGETRAMAARLREAQSERVAGVGGWQASTR